MKNPFKQVAAPKTDGWVYINGATRWHYVRVSDGRSLCGNWLFLGSAYPEQGNDDSKDNCAACRRKLLKSKQPSDTGAGK